MGTKGAAVLWTVATREECQRLFNQTKRRHALTKAHTGTLTKSRQHVNKHGGCLAQGKYRNANKGRMRVAEVGGQAPPALLQWPQVNALCKGACVAQVQPPVTPPCGT